MKLTIVEEGSARAIGIGFHFTRNGHAVDVSAFTAALAAVGMGKVAPRPVSEETALRRAIDKTKPSRLKKLSLRKGAWTVHLVYKGHSHQELPQQFSVKIAGDKPFINFETEEIYGLRSQLEAAFAYHLANYEPEDIRAWWKKLAAEAMDAVPIMGGGIVFIPKAKLAVFRQIEEVLKGFGFSFDEITVAEDDEKAAQTVINGFRDKALKELQEVRDMLAENIIDDPAKANERTLKARRARVEVLEKLRAQLKRYEDITRKPLADLEAEVLKIRMEIAQTSFVNAEAEMGRITQSLDATQKRFALLEVADQPEHKPEETIEDMADDGAYKRFALLETDDIKKPVVPDEDENEIKRKIDLDDDE